MKSWGIYVFVGGIVGLLFTYDLAYGQYTHLVNQFLVGCVQS